MFSANLFRPVPNCRFSGVLILPKQRPRNTRSGRGGRRLFHRFFSLGTTVTANPFEVNGIVRYVKHLLGHVRELRFTPIVRLEVNHPITIPADEVMVVGGVRVEPVLVLRVIDLVNKAQIHKGFQHPVHRCPGDFRHFLLHTSIDLIGRRVFFFPQQFLEDFAFLNGNSKVFLLAPALELVKFFPESGQFVISCK